MDADRTTSTAEPTFGPGELPSHPEWCKNAGQPSDACAWPPGPGPFTSLEHYSVIDRREPAPRLCLARYDDAESGIGPVEIGIEVYEDYTCRPDEARAIAFELLAAAHAAEAAERG
jgi:hypothetical protein